MIFKANEISKTFLVIAIVCLLIASCDLYTPPEPVHDNPWDPLNPNPPRSPLSVNAAAESETVVRLNWRDGSGNEEGYNIYESVENDTSFQFLSANEANDTVQVLSGKHPATRYYYHITAYNEAGESQPLGCAASTAEVAPTEPVILSAEAISATAIRLRWEDRSYNENMFGIEESVGDSSNFEQVVGTAKNMDFQILPEREMFETYYYRICAQNDYGKSEYSDVVWAAPGSFPPEAPSGLMAEPASEIDVELNWLDNSDNEESFEIFTSVGDTAEFTSVAAEANETHFIVSDCQPGIFYYFKIRAVNRYGMSEFSRYTVTTTSDALPAAPGEFSGEPVAAASIALSWIDRSSIETGYRIEASEDGGENFTELETTEPNVEEYLVEELTPFATYFFRIRTEGASFNSRWSETIAITAGSIAPAAPTGLTAEAQSLDEILLTWTDNSSNEEQFHLQESLYKDRGWETVLEPRANLESIRLHGRQSGATYYYRIKAVNAWGESGYSNTAQTTTPSVPAAPSNVRAEGISPQEIRLAWNDNSNNEDGFIIEQSPDDMYNFTVIDSVEAGVQGFTVSGLEQFVTYFYRIRAYNEWGASPYSDVDYANAFTAVVFAGCGEEGVIAVNISDMEHPVSIGRIDTPGYARGLGVDFPYLYAADSHSGVRIIDISDPQNVREESFIETVGRTRTVVCEDRWGYVPDESNGLVIMNFSDPASPRISGHLETPDYDVWDVAINGNYAYLAAGDGGLVTVSIADQGAPSVQNEFATPSASYGIAIDGSYVFLADYASGMRIFNVSSPGNPVEVGDVDIPNNGMAIDVDVANDHAFIAGYYHGLRIIDISVIEEPVEISHVDTPGQAWDVKVYRNHAIVADYDGGIRIIDVQDLLNPNEVSNIVPPGRVTGVAVVEYR